MLNSFFILKIKMLFYNWEQKLQPLIEKYKGRKHPLDCQNPYQLMIMVILSAQDSDANINTIAPVFFHKYPNLKMLTTANPEELQQDLSKVRNNRTKTVWLIEIAQTLKEDKNIPKNLTNLTALKGIGRKSANVILHELNLPAEGIIADLHVIRVAPRIGLATESTDGNKIEKQLMQELPQSMWNDIGMAISFLGREICRPTNPKCTDCPVAQHCKFNNK